MKYKGSRKKHSLVRVFLYSLFALSTLPVIVLGYFWIASDFDRFTSQHQQWRETYTESRNQLLRREVDKALEYIHFRRERFDQVLYKQLRREIRSALVVARDIRVSAKADESRAQLIDKVSAAVAPMRFGEGGFFYLLDGSGAFRLTPLAPNSGQRLNNSNALTALANQIKAGPDAASQRFIQFSLPASANAAASRNVSFVFQYKPLDIYLVASTYVEPALEELKAEVLERLAAIPFDPDSSVLFVTDKNGAQLVNPYNPGAIGEPLSGVGDWVAALQADEADDYVKIAWPRSDAAEAASVQSYVSLYQPWGWVIGAGFFLDEFNRLIEAEQSAQRQRYLKQIRFIVLISLLVLLLGILIARLLIKRVERGFTGMQDFFDAAAKRSVNINLRDLTFSEFEELAEHANYMVDTRTETESKLIDARIQAEDASHAKSQFLSSVSHELRTPLNGVLGYTQLLLRAEGIAPEERRHLAAIETCGNHLLTLINDVLDLAKIESGNMELDIRSHRLSALLSSVGDIVRQRAQSKGLRYEVNLQTDIPAWVKLDAVKLRQVLVNLLDNGVKFTTQGFVELSVTLAAGQRLHFAVRDTGRGIEAEHLEEVFEPFKQTNPHEGIGTGLGLSICFRLVETMGGSLSAESEFGRGTVFSFDLPLVEGEAKVSGDDDEDGASELVSVDLHIDREIDIIIADDNNFNRQVMRGMVQGFAGRVREAHDGEEVLQMMAERPADVVLMDMKMPVLDGVEATRRLKADARYPNLKIVMVTATIEAAAIAKAHDAGTDGFLAKPVKLSELLHELAEQLGGEIVEQSGDVAEPEAALCELPELDSATRKNIQDAVAIGDIKALRALFSALQDQSDDHAGFARQANAALDDFDFDTINKLLGEDE